MQFVPPTDPTRAAIFKAYEAARSSYESVGVPIGDIAKECDRDIWYSFRRCSPPEVVDGKKIRIFERGDIEEERLINDLQDSGHNVQNRQAKTRLVGGHVRGKIDGEATGVRGDPETVHLVECKSSKEKYFKPLQTKGMQVAFPSHYGQAQTYMHARGLKKCLYLCTNKNDEEIYTEIVPYDEAYCLRAVARAERIIRNDDPPSKLHEDPNAKAAFVCKMCRHKPVCHDGDWPRRNCRTCIHATPVTTSTEACWNCSKWNQPLTLAEQEKGCASHLFIPALVPGKQSDADPDNATVTYTLHSGETWVNGRAG